MSADTATAIAEDPVTDRRTTKGASLPTAPCSVVWSGGHAYVLEGGHGRSRWVGVDDRGRPTLMSHADLQRRGWSRTRL
ncbi:hypothetical protein [Allokutzneria sp. NRRL B-24872]|uniref:hypothetical protein n=1 Tax=Allokutzneria sp. NRRL B-24872 TaxID=1137961 RepID=UPI0011777758|nr:hypothetical protein [Allokutzneria sp. NRRL B-24872]